MNIKLIFTLYFRAYFENVLNYSSDTSECHLDSVVFRPDTPGHFNDIKGNKGAEHRGWLFKPNEEVELCGRLHIDMLNCSKWLLDNVSIGLNFELNNPSFYLQKTNKDNPSTLQILDATLYIDHCKINPELALYHQQVLDSGKNAVYNYKRCEVRNYMVPANVTSFSWDNICMGPLCDFVIFAMLDSNSYNGDYTTSPYEFKNYDLSSFNVSVNGIEICPRNLAFNFDQQNPLSQHAYYSLFRQLNLHKSDKANVVTRKFFNNGGFMLGYDLSADREAGNDCGNFVNSGSMRIEVKFKKPLPNSITVLAYLQFDSDLIIDRDRNIHTNYV